MSVPGSLSTGADSPVIAASLTKATPSITSPSPGMTSPAATRTMSPSRSSDDGYLFERAVALALRHRVAAHRAQRVRLRLAAPFGHRLGEVGEQDREPEPSGDRAAVKNPASAREPNDDVEPTGPS